MFGVFRVVFQDVGFENTSFKPLNHIGFSSEVHIPSVVEGQDTIITNPHILNHHIPELPNVSKRRAAYARKLMWE